MLAHVNPSLGLYGHHYTKLVTSHSIILFCGTKASAYILRRAQGSKSGALHCCSVCNFTTVCGKKNGPTILYMTSCATYFKPRCAMWCTTCCTIPSADSIWISVHKNPAISLPCTQAPLCKWQAGTCSTGVAGEAELPCCCLWKSTIAALPACTWGGSLYTGFLRCTAFSMDYGRVVLPHLLPQYHTSLVARWLRVQPIKFFLHFKAANQTITFWIVILSYKHNIMFLCALGQIPEERMPKD